MDNDTISRQAAIDAIKTSRCLVNALKKTMKLPSAQPEPFTDAEQRIFLSAIERELEVCKEIDSETVREAYEVSLTQVCKEIKRKVMGALWT